ncbi:MAG: GspH/FimT family pseudopilin [Gammaproteobacteria bacterium]|jgi:type IV fimbrial biogenesis protein FimT
MNMERENGFTLVELLVTIVVISILLAAGVPSFMEFIKNNRLSAQANNLVISIQEARNEAVKRGSGAVICASSDQATCSGSDDWTTGWIAFSDMNQNGSLDLGGGDCDIDDCIVRTNGSIDKATLDGSGTDNIVFQPDGRISGAATTITITADECQRQQVRAITITPQGNTIVTKQDCP